jgi:alkanesulfonate monooxygenase
LHVIEGGLSPAYLGEFARAHDAAGFDMALVGYSSSSAEGFLVALYAAMQTERLGYLVAHRPGFVAPTLLARKIATFDHLTSGRLAVHIITGKSDDEQQGDGDFSPKDERYRRATEYLQLMKLAWSNDRPFDFSGEFYRVKGAHSDVRPLQEPHPLLFFGGASVGALEMGARLCDVYAIYAEPLTSTRERIAQFRAQAAAFGRVPGFNVSVRPIIAASEGAAWDKAKRILAAMGVRRAGADRNKRSGRSTMPASGSCASHWKAMFTTNACGCRLHAQPVRSAIRRVWSGLRSKLRTLSSNTIDLGWTRS